MTPTDALIEKMARAIAIADGWPSAHADQMFRKVAFKADEYRRLARAAYEAEHEETKG